MRILPFVGVAALALGIYLVARPVTCEGRAMQRGDTCQHYSGGSLVDEKDYSQEALSQKLFGVVILVIGIAGIVAPAIIALRHRWSSMGVNWWPIGGMVIPIWLAPVTFYNSLFDKPYPTWLRVLGVLGSFAFLAVAIGLLLLGLRGKRGLT